MKSEILQNNNLKIGKSFSRKGRLIDMKINNIYRKLIELLTISVGIFSLMPIVTFKGISIFSLIFPIFILYLIFVSLNKRKTVIINKASKYYLLFLIISMVGTTTGIFFFAEKKIWMNAVIGFIPKIVLFFIFDIFLLLSSERVKLCKLILKGSWIGFILNVVWTILDGLCFYIFRFSLSNIVFKRYASTITSRQFISIILNNGTIRSTGFNYDPAQLGYIVPIVVGYGYMKNNIYLVAIGFLAMIFSQSTTSIVCTFICIAFVFKLKNNKISKKVKIYSIIVALILLTIGSIILFSTDNRIVNIIFKASSGFFYRINNSYIKSDKNIRLLYYLYTVPAFLNNPLIYIFGTGFGSGAYAFISSQFILNRFDRGIANYQAYDPELVYVSYLFDTGILGLICYLRLLFVNIKKAKLESKFEENEKLMLLLSLYSITLCGLFYSYTLMASQILILAVSSVLLFERK